MSETGDRQNAVLDAVAEHLRAEARSYAAQVRLLAELGKLSRQEGQIGGVPQFPMIELAGSARVGQTTATRLLVEADRLVTALPLTVQSLESADLLVHQAKVLLAETGSCTPEVARAVEATVLPGAAELCPADLRKRVKSAVLLIESELDAAREEQARAEQRLADARAKRRTFTVPEPDGMGLAAAILTAEQLRSWSLDLDALERIERRADREAGVDRTADQRRADLFAALPAMVLTARSALAGLVPDGTDRPTGRADGRDADRAARRGPDEAGPDDAGPGDGAPQDGAPSGEPDSSVFCRLPELLRPGGSATPRPVVLNLLVPVATVLDLSREPGSVPGYGPVNAEHVRLLRPVGFRRVLVDHDTGEPMAVDDRVTPVDPDPVAARRQVLDMLRPEVIRDVAEPQHDPSAHLSRLVDVRDAHCAGPGCSSPRCHRDHRTPHPEGPTAAWNLNLLSDRCHQAKHAEWTMIRHPGGATTWHSPLGRRYTRPPPHRAPPKIDPDAELPPLRPPPTAAPPWDVRAREVGTDARDDDARPSGDDDAAPLPDDPPF